MQNFKEMPKFFAKIIVLLLLTVLAIVVLNRGYMSINPYAESDLMSERESVDIANRIKGAAKKDIDVMNVGSSHGRDAFDYSMLESKGIHGVNFSFSGQSLSYDYRILEQYQNKFVKGGVAFIVISYFSFNVDEEHDNTFVSKNMRYYNVLEPKYIKDYNVKYTWLLKYPLLGAKDKLISSFRNAIFPPQAVEAPPEPQVSPEARAKADGEYAAKSHIEQQAKHMVQGEIDALYNMIKLLKKHGVTPVLVTTPYLKEYDGRVDKKHKAMVKAEAKKIAAEEGIVYYDYSEDGRFQGRYDLFNGAHHLNDVGRKMFMSILFKEVPEAAELLSLKGK